jgi:hypothetical protein
MNHGGQRGNLLANILARRIQKTYRQYKLRRNNLIKTMKDSSNQHILLKQAKLCLDNKKLDDQAKAQSLMIADENNAEERRRVFARSKTTTAPITGSDESQ